MFAVNKKRDSKTNNLKEDSSIWKDVHVEGSKEAVAISEKRISAMKERRTIRQRQKNVLETGLNSAIPVENIGYTLIKKMGYKEGNPLGRMGVGLIEPLKVSLEFQHRKGLADNNEKQKKKKNSSKKQSSLYGAFISGGYNTEQVPLKNESESTPDIPKIIHFNTSYKLSNTTRASRKSRKRQLRSALELSRKARRRQQYLEKRKLFDMDNNSELCDDETSFKKMRIALSKDVKLLKAKLNAYLGGEKTESSKRYVERNATTVSENIELQSLLVPKTGYRTSSRINGNEIPNIENFSPNHEFSRSISGKVGSIKDYKTSLSKKLKSLKSKLNTFTSCDELYTDIQQEALGNSCQVIIESDPQLKPKEIEFVMEILAQKALDDDSGCLLFFRHEPIDSNKFIVISGNNSSLKWLKSEIATISKSWFGPTLRVLITQNVNMIWKVSFEIDALLSKEQLLNIFKVQFPELRTNQWFFEKIEILQFSRTYVEAIIDEYSMLLLHTSKIRRYFGLERIKLEMI